MGDVDGDGVSDLIATGDGFVDVLFGSGNGTFRVGPIGKSTGISGFPTTPVDVNGDGILDLLISGGNDQGIGGFGVCLGRGDGTFKTGVFYAAGTDSFRIFSILSTGDFNSDGILDVVQVGPSGLWLFTGRGDGTFNPGVVVAPLEIGGTSLATADFNEDGKLDVVVVIAYTGVNQDQGDGFFVLFGNGNGTFQTPVHYTKPTRPYWVVAGKLGGSGHAGIVLSDFDNQLYDAVYLGDGGGSFSGPQYIALNTKAECLGIADMNGDGIPDLISADSEAYVAFGTADGSFQEPVGYPIETGDTLFNLALADLRNNGRNDILTDAQDAISVLLNTGKGKFEDGILAPPNLPSGCGVSADFNGDGKPDIAVNTSEGITILLGTGKGYKPLSLGSSITLAGAGCLKASGDLNGDGIPDLVITSPTTVNAYLGNGDGTFTLKSATPVTATNGYVLLADFNGDGKLDFVTPQNLLALGNGDGTFQTPLPFVVNPPAQGFDNLAIGDLNNDGWPDVVLTNNDFPYVNLYVLLNDHMGGFTQLPQNFGFGTTGAFLADLNGDGNLDLLTTGQVYLGDGTGNFTFLMYIGVLYGTNIDIAADINGDGIPDILTVGIGDVQVYLGKGDATYSAPFYFGTGPAPGDLLTANLHGQSAAAGLPDLVAPDGTGGVVVLVNQTR